MKRTVPMVLLILLLVCGLAASTFSVFASTPTVEKESPFYQQFLDTQRAAVGEQITLLSSKNQTYTASLSRTVTAPGEYLILTAKGIPEGVSVTARSTTSFQPTFFRQKDGSYKGILPISLLQEPGEYRVTIVAGNRSRTYGFTVTDREYPIQHLVVDEQTTSQTINSEEANREYARVIGSVVQTEDTTNYWETSEFQWPTKGGWISTPFGAGRTINGNPSSYRHDAIDIALPLGTRVEATNHGRVLFAGYLQLTGNTVIIEHGNGLKSWYFHMESLDIHSGDRVTIGQKLGTVGSTGFSNGPHLHFGFSVRDVPIDPYLVLGKTLYN